jgi:hypothetical protein
MTAPVAYSLLSSGDNGVDFIESYINQIMPDEIRYNTNVPDISYTLVVSTQDTTVNNVKGTIVYNSTTVTKQCQTPFTNSYLNSTNDITVALQSVLNTNSNSYVSINKEVTVIINGVSKICKFYTTVLNTKYYIIE